MTTSHLSYSKVLFIMFPSQTQQRGKLNFGWIILSKEYLTENVLIDIDWSHPHSKIHITPRKPVVWYESSRHSVPYKWYYLHLTVSKTHKFGKLVGHILAAILISQLLRVVSLKLYYHCDQWCGEEHAVQSQVNMKLLSRPSLET